MFEFFGFGKKNEEVAQVVEEKIETQEKKPELNFVMEGRRHESFQSEDKVCEYIVERLIASGLKEKITPEDIKVYAINDTGPVPSPGISGERGYWSRTVTFTVSCQVGYDLIPIPNCKVQLNENLTEGHSGVRGSYSVSEVVGGQPKIH